MSVAAGDLRVQSESLYALILVPKTKQRLTRIRLCNFGVSINLPSYSLYLCISCRPL